MTPKPFDSFDRHESTPEQAEAMHALCTAARIFRDRIHHLPNGREKSLALTNLEQALMWANVAAVTPPTTIVGSALSGHPVRSSKP